MFNRLVLQVALPVTLPYLADGNRRDGSVVPSLVRAMGLLTALGWPFLVAGALLAWPAIRLLYGPQWTSVAPLAQVLCAAAAVELVHRFGTQVLFSLGKAREANRLTFTVQGLRVTGVSMAIWFGLPGAAWGWLAAAVLGLLVSQWTLRRHAGLTVADTLQAVRGSALVAAAVAAPLLVLVGVWPPGEGNFVVLLGLGCALAVCSWCAGAAGTSHPAWSQLSQSIDQAFEGRGEA
jgi:O-antigen/teichoic acid export membrane protein